MKSHLTPCCLSSKLQSLLTMQGVPKLKGVAVVSHLASPPPHSVTEMLQSSVQPASNNNKKQTKKQQTIQQKKGKSSKKKKADLGLQIPKLKHWEVSLVVVATNHHVTLNFDYGTPWLRNQARTKHTMPILSEV